MPVECALPAHLTDRDGGGGANGVKEWLAPGARGLL